MSSVKSKRGRPVTGRAKSNQFHVRLDDETMAMVDYICEKKGLNKTDMFKDIVRAQYNLAKFMD